jgi:hypothetical protein
MLLITNKTIGVGTEGSLIISVVGGIQGILQCLKQTTTGMETEMETGEEKEVIGKMGSQFHH